MVELVKNVIEPSQIAGLVESFDEGDLSLTALNTELKAIDYEVKPIYDTIEKTAGLTGLETKIEKNQKLLLAYASDPTKTVTNAVFQPGDKVTGYQLLKNGIPFNLLAAENDLSLDGVQAYLRNNLSSKETSIIKESLVNTYDNWVQLQQAKKVELEKKISLDDNASVVKQYIKDNTLSKDIPEYLKLVNEKGDVNFSEEEIKHITKYFERNNLIVSDKNLGIKSASEMMKKYTNTSNLDLKLNEFVEQNIVEFPGLREKLEKAVDLKALVKNSLIGPDGDGGLRRSMIDKRFDTMHGSAIREIGKDEQTIIDTGGLLSKTEGALQDKSLAYKMQKLELASQLLEEIPKIGIIAIDEKIKEIEGVKYNFQNIEGQGSFYSISAPKDLNNEDQAKFNEAQAMLFKIQNTLQTLQEDKTQTIENFKNQIVNLKFKEVLDESEKKERTKAEVDLLITTVNEDTGSVYTVKEATDYIKKRDSQEINMYDAFSKEYGTAELMAKDFGDATYGIFLALPTLAGSQWAIDEQVRLNQKNEVYMTMGELGDGSGNKSLFALRTLSQQFPNILMAIGTGSAGTALKLSGAMVKTSIATTFGVTSGADTYRRLTIQTGLVDQAKQQQTWLKGAYKEGLIDQSTYANGMADAAQTIAFNDMSDEQIQAASFMTGVVEGGVTRYIGSANNTVKILKDIRGYPIISQTALANKNTLLGKYGLYGMEYGKRVGGELIEESTILICT